MLFGSGRVGSGSSDTCAESQWVSQRDKASQGSSVFVLLPLLSFAQSLGFTLGEHVFA
jgi:hypothetical protein